MKDLRELVHVYFIMGSPNCYLEPKEVVRGAIAGGITLFQFREKGEGALMDAEKRIFAKELQAICRENHIPFIVNDDIELALAIGADGVHIGQEDEPVKTVRERIGEKILGVSVHSLEEAEIALRDGADYFGIGPVFPTKTKEDAKPSNGTSLIEALRKNGYTIPIVGIGGITCENAAAVIEAGADGVSVITAISQAESPCEAAKAIHKGVNRG
ncbi:thiamine phosphate synthase [Neobacillus sp. MM2021_6]|uniref:thiamine phosphate synthase n=1 Tax=Bacillaceae TaxID=186817 RepID=UPI00140CE072|nr:MULTISPECIES: thiamine phosphate synthase [Bacillaceae]MBO0961111.1 thiamine phosphate synthase [Neobacillus sp. MM2021_6]NHC21130.1 thiamine phosphate synthase [Bacillus sp. MM2020_4]